MILAAGRGTRLEPLTDQRPKPLLPLVHLTLLHFPLLLARHAGIRDVTMNLHHLGHQIRHQFGDGGNLGLSIRYSEEQPLLLGTGGGIKRAREFLAGETFVILNGDTLVDVDLPAVMEAHERSGATATMVLAEPRPGRNFGLVRVDDSQQVRDIAGRLGWKGDGGRAGHFCGIHVMEPRVFDYMPAQEVFCINAEVYPRMIAAGERVVGCFLARDFRDVGTPERYLETAEAILDGTLHPAYLGDAALEARCDLHAFPGNVWMAKGARVDPSASIQGPVYAGPGAVIGPRARVGPYALLAEGSRVGEGAQVRHAILWGSALLPPGDVLERAILTSRLRLSLGAAQG
jgi:mannose-1-phosphate guanylyltransferase